MTTIDLTADEFLWLTENGGDLVAELMLGDEMVRLPLGRFPAGILVAAVPPADLGPIRLAARVAAGRVQRFDLHAPAARTVLTGAAADGWVSALAAAIARLVDQPRHVDLTLAPGDRSAVTAAMVLGARRTAGWLMADRPCLVGFGMGSPVACLALPPGSWARVMETASITVAAATFLAARGTLVGAVRETQHAFLTALPTAAALAAVDRHLALRGRDARAAALLLAAERRALGETAPSVSHLLPDEPGVAAMSVLADHVGLPLVVPERRWRQTLDQPFTVHEIARASGFRLRRIDRDAAAHRIDRQPMIARADGEPQVTWQAHPTPDIADGDDTAWLVPIHPLRGGRVGARAMLRFGMAWRTRAAASLRLRLALLDRLCRLPVQALRRTPPAAWLARLDRLDSLALRLLMRMRRATLLGVLAVLAGCAIAIIGGGDALLAAALLAFGAASSDGDPPAWAPFDAMAFHYLERLPKLQAIGGERWGLLAWYGAEGTRGRTAPWLAALRAALHGICLAAAPLLGLAATSDLSIIGRMAAATAMLAAVAAGGATIATIARGAGDIRALTSGDSVARAFDLDEDGTASRTDPGVLSGRLASVGLAFRPAREDRPLFADLDLTVEPGEFVALIGPPGSGKSTLLHLLLGLETPTGGSVFYDGYDLRGLDPAAIARNVASMLQRDRLQPGTIRDNLQGAESLTDAAIWAGLDEIGLAREIAAFPARLDTRLPEGHRSLSLGQAQRLLLARAWLRRANLLLLDEPTSALDGEAEQSVVRALRQNSATRLIVSHRPALIRAADRVIDLRTIGRVTSPR